jgi:trans-aconitate methyltransferase
MNRWKAIWNNRKIADAGSILEKLLTANGYDSVFGKMAVAPFMAFITMIRAELGIGAKDTIFEVGCGAGAALYPFYTGGQVVSGLDYSKPLIALAAGTMPDMTFHVGEADQVDVAQKFDIVLSCGAFIYFESYDYARKVTMRMIQKAKKAIGIFDISDLALKSKAESLRREGMGAREYDEKYRGLEHLYYPRSFFNNVARASGCKVRIFAQSIEGYKNSTYRYNVILVK